MSEQPITSNRLEFNDAIESIEYYLERGLTDGLPIVPPTVERVQKFLNKVDRLPAEIIATEPTKGRVVTVEKVAINAVMAGCRPEYFPVVLTAIEAIGETTFNLHAITASTMGAAVLTVVNGPIVADLSLNSSVGVFGPGHRANATIGRAIRLVIINATGAVPGELDQATLGHAGKYTWCIGEAESVSPWSPLHVDRGMDIADSTVSVFAGLSPIQVNNHESNDPEGIITSLSGAIYAAGPSQTEIVVVLCPEHVGFIRDARWSKNEVREFLFNVTHRSVSEWKSVGYSLEGESTKLIPSVNSPDGITLLVAGGMAGGFSAVIPLWLAGLGSRSVTKKIQ